MIKESKALLDAIERLPGWKYVSIGILPTEIRNYTVSQNNLVSGNRLPLLYALTQAMDQGGTLVIKHQLNLKIINDDKEDNVYNWYAAFLGERTFRVCTKLEFDSVFKRPGQYKLLKI